MPREDEEEDIGELCESLTACSHTSLFALSLYPLQLSEGVTSPCWQSAAVAPRPAFYYCCSNNTSRRCMD